MGEARLEELRFVLHRVRAWALEVDDDLDKILELTGGEVTPPPPDQTGTPLPGPQAA